MGVKAKVGVQDVWIHWCGGPDGVRGVGCSLQHYL